MKIETYITSRQIVRRQNDVDVTNNIKISRGVDKRQKKSCVFAVKFPRGDARLKYLDCDRGKYLKYTVTVGVTKWTSPILHFAIPPPPYLLGMAKCRIGLVPVGATTGASPILHCAIPSPQGSVQYYIMTYPPPLLSIRQTV